MIRRSSWQKVFAVSAGVLAGSILLWPLFRLFTPHETQVVWESIMGLLVAAVLYLGMRVWLTPPDD